MWVRTIFLDPQSVHFHMPYVWEWLGAIASSGREVSAPRLTPQYHDNGFILLFVFVYNIFKHKHISWCHGYRSVKKV